MSETLNRLNKLSLYVGIVAKVLMALIGLLLIVMVITAIYFALDPDMVSELFTDLSYGQVQSMAVTIIAICVGGFSILFFVNRLFVTIHKNHTPFLEENVRNLNIIAVLVVVMALAVPALEILLAYALKIESVLAVNFNVTMLFMAFLVYLVSLVFRYGVILQKESDETL